MKRGGPGLERGPPFQGRRVTVQVDANAWQQAARIAKAQGITVSLWLREIIEEAIRRFETQTKKERQTNDT